jgi:hypothetical protein
MNQQDRGQIILYQTQDGESRTEAEEVACAD